MSYIKIQKIVKENVDIPEKGYIYFGYDSGGLWIKDDDGTPAYYILAGYSTLPTISSISPSQGYEGQQISVYGNGFVANAIVNFGNITATTVNVLSSTQITVIVPSGVGTGIVSVNVTTQNGTSNSVNFIITTQTAAPHIDSITPLSQIGDYFVTIQGSNFQSGITTYFNYVESQTTNFTNSTYLTSKVPLISTGQTSVWVETNQGSSNIVTIDIINNTNPIITGFNPSSGYTGDTINIIGLNFVTGTSVKFGSYAASGVTILSSTGLTAVIPQEAVPGPTSIIVNVSSLSGFTISGITDPNVPYIISITPLNYGPDQIVTISGNNMSNVTSITFGGIPADISSIGGSYSKNVKIGSTTPLGDNIVNAINSYGKSNDFHYNVSGGTSNNPSITDFNPWSGITGDYITISGTNFIYGPNINGVFFAGILSSYRVGLSTNQILATIPNGVPSGPIDIKVQNTNGSTTKSGFIINTQGGTPPVISSVSSYYGNYGKVGDIIDIYGQYLSEWDGYSWTPAIIKIGFSFNSATYTSSVAVLGEEQTHIQTIIPSGMASPGNFFTYNIYVVTNSGSTSWTPFDIFEPPTQLSTITGFFPTSGKIGDTITLSGTNLCKYWNSPFIGVVAGSPPKPLKISMIQNPWVSNSYMTVIIPPEVGAYTGASGFEVDNQIGGTPIAGFTITS